MEAGTFRLGLDTTINGGTLLHEGGTILWKGGTLNGVTYDGTLKMKNRGGVLAIGPDGLVVTGSDGTGPGIVDLSRGSTLYFGGVQTFDNATINLDQSSLYAFVPVTYSILTLGSNTVVNHTGGYSFIRGFPVTNDGTINANSTTPGASLVIDSYHFANQGVITVSNGDTLDLKPYYFTNLISGTLAGGEYEVDAGSILELGLNATVVSDDAVITLSGAGSVIQSQNSAHQEVSIESTLTRIRAAGTLKLLAGRDWSSTNALRNSGTLVLGGGTFISSALTNNRLISGNGVIGVAIANSGIIEAATGTLDLTQAITGSGTMKIDAGATLELGGAAASTLTVRFFEGAGTLDLANPSGFAATLHGFAPTDTIDLLNTLADAATLGAGDTLVITDNGSTVATLKLGGDYAAATFHVASDGHGGTNITVSVPGAAVVHPAPSHPFIAAMAGLGGRAGGSAGPMGTVHAEDRRLALPSPRMAQFA